MRTPMRLLLLLLLTTVTLYVQAQEKRTVSGTVQDSAGRGLPDISVLVKGTKTGTVTDAQGNFKINLPPSNHVLEFSSVGYKSQEVEVSLQSTITVTLQGINNALNEVVVTGFGTRTNARKLSYSVTQVSGAEITKANNANFVDALQGKVAGVFISQGAGGPSSSAKIRIRGNSRLGGNTQPLVVIDGILIQPDITGADSWGGNQDFGNIIKDLNPDDYESITVLKGSAASALYGSKALNGVLLITTKKGVARKGLGVSFTHTESYDKAYKGLDLQNEYGGGISPTFQTDSTGMRIVDPVYASALTTPFYDGASSFGPKFDGKPVKDLDGRIVPYVANNPLDFFQTGKYINTNIAVEGGNDLSTFRFSYSNLYNSSVMPNNHLGRNSFDLRATQKVSKIISLDASINYTNNKVLNPIVQGGNNSPLLGFTYYMPRNAPINYYLNNYIDTLHGGRKNYDQNEDPYLLANMFWSYFQNNTTRSENNLLANVDLNTKITPWLNLLIRSNINNYNDITETKNLGTGDNFVGGSYSLIQSNYRNIRVQGLLNLNKNIGKNFDLTATIGGENYRQLGGFRSNASTNGGLSTPKLFTIANSSSPANISVSKIPTLLTDAIYAYGDLTWKDMLTFNFSLRNDWSSALTYANGSGKYSYLYPSVGLAWAFTQLPYFKNSNSVLSYGKLRASFAYTGYDQAPYTLNQTGNYAITGTFNGASGTQQIYTYNNDNGNVLPNLNLKNELDHELEFGADIRFFHDKLSLDATYYKKNSINQVFGVSVPVESGVARKLINAGNIQNQGIELLLSATPVQTKNFTWNASINYTRNRNKVISLAPGTPEVDLELAFGNTVRAEAIPGHTYGTVVTGSAFATYQAKDANGNAISSPSNGKRVIGYNTGVCCTVPDYLTYMKSSDYDGTEKKLGTIMEKYLASTTQSFSYKNFNLSFQVDTKIGGLIASATDQYSYQTGAFKSSLFGRDAAHGGVTYTDASGISHDDGIIPEGVLNNDVKVTADGQSVNLGGMSYADAVTKGYLKPIPAYAYYYNLTTWASGIREFSIFENSWVAVRQVSVGYTLPKKFSQRMKLNNLRVLLTGRNLGYLYKTAHDGINPESLYNNNAAGFAEYGGLPYVRSLGFTVNASF